MAGEYTSPFAIPLEHDSDQSAFTVFMVVVLAIWADHVRMRSPFIVLGLVLAAIGYGINISTAPIGVKYFGTFLSAIGGYSAFPATISWYVLHIKSLQLPSAKRQGADGACLAQGAQQCLGALQARRRTRTRSHLRQHRGHRWGQRLSSAGPTAFPSWK